MRKTLALDLEGTLISNALPMDCTPRPGLWDFLSWAKRHFRVVLYTNVFPRRARASRTSLGTWLSSANSATRRLSRRFSSSRLRSLRASATCNPPHLPAPLVERCVGYRVLPAQLSHSYACFGLLENPNDLLFGETALLMTATSLADVTNK